MSNTDTQGPCSQAPCPWSLYVGSQRQAGTGKAKRARVREAQHQESEPLPIVGFYGACKGSGYSTMRYALSKFQVMIGEHHRWAGGNTWGVTSKLVTLNRLSTWLYWQVAKPGDAAGVCALDTLAFSLPFFLEFPHCFVSFSFFLYYT